MDYRLRGDVAGVLVLAVAEGLRITRNCLNTPKPKEPEKSNAPRMSRSWDVQSMLDYVCVTGLLLVYRVEEVVLFTTTLAKVLRRRSRC